MSRSFLKLAVIGDPVEHSQSPKLHAEFMAQEKLAGSYQAIRVRASEAAVRLTELHTEGYLGLNVTTPLKEEVAALLESRDELVERIGATNTLVATPTGWHGANTDGIGVCCALKTLLSPLRTLTGLRVLILGTGPTARAAIVSLAEEGASVTLWSRTSERAQQTATNFGVACWESALRFDAIVSTLPPAPDLPQEVLALLQTTRFVMDANYGARATLQTLVPHPIVDGKAMLEAQAWASFCRWKHVFHEGSTTTTTTP